MLRGILSGVGESLTLNSEGFVGFRSSCVIEERASSE
jgi:hypothetical protein